MQFNLYINQKAAAAWGLNDRQALIFDVIHQLPTWAKTVFTGDGEFYAISKQKIADELPIMSVKPDTVYRHLKVLADKGLIHLSSTNKITLVAVTNKGIKWSRGWSEKNPTKDDGSEINPTWVGNKSEAGSEINPTNHEYHNHDNQNNKEAANAATRKPKPKIAKKDLIQDYGIPEDLAAEYLQIRKDKRQTLTPTAMKRLVSQFEKAGLSIPEGIKICCEHSWAGFNASWDWGEKTKGPTMGGVYA